MENERASGLTPAGRRLSSMGKKVTLEAVKGTLLAIADQMLSTMSEIILENAHNEKGKSHEFAKVITLRFLL